MAESVTRPRLPWPFAAVNRLGELFGLDDRRSWRFDREKLEEDARRTTGLEDFGEAGFYQEGLEHLLDSLEEADLTLVGRIGLRGMVVTLLANRLLLARERRAASECFQIDLHPPLIVLGLPRSGTTFLHRLLALDPASRALPMWRLQRPFPPSRGPDRRQAETKRVLALTRRLAPDIDNKHLIRFDAAEECIWLLNSTFVSHGFWISAPVYSYVKWLARTPRLEAYRDYADFLRYFQSEEASRRLVLKAPAHLGNLGEIREVLPEALVVQTHRDPVTVVPSLSSLLRSVQAMVCRHLDAHALASTNVAILQEELERNRRARLTRPGLLIDVEYDELVRDPEGTLRRIYQGFHLPWTPEYEVSLRNWLAGDGQNRGRHHYTPDEFGWDERKLAAAFEDYRLWRGYG